MHHFLTKLSSILNFFNVQVFPALVQMFLNFSYVCVDYHGLIWIMYGIGYGFSSLVCVQQSGLTHHLTRENLIRTSPTIGIGIALIGKMLKNPPVHVHSSFLYPKKLDYNKFWFWTRNGGVGFNIGVTFSVLSFKWYVLSHMSKLISLVLGYRT